ncbi:MAG: O-antigen ligase family protein [Chthoniobacterales bacterium]
MEESPHSASRNRRRPTPDFSWEDLATALLPVLACFLGGATEKWAEGIIVALLGALLLLNPPRFSLGPIFHGILLALIACAAIAFLPAHWFLNPAWRQSLLNDFGLSLPATLSPQPWVSVGCFLSFLAGLCWLYYVAGGDVEVRASRRQLRIFTIGVIALAAFAILFYLRQTAPSFWHNERRFGPFPNRNQTADLFGITSVLIVACAHDEIRRHKNRWIFWLLGLAVVITAIVLNFSRAGIVLLVVGSVAWLAVLVLRSGSIARIAVGAAALLALLAGLLLFGGQTLERFQLHGAAGAALTSDFRWLIFHDALSLISASPWCGVGLGNFQPVFALFRDVSLGQTRALHPESDWLGLAAEIGWPGVILILLGVVVLLRRAFPFVEGTNQWFRIAALIGALLFALHGLADVSGHRVGSAYAGIFLFGMTVQRPLRKAASIWLTNAFRFIGLLLLGVGLVWVVTVYRDLPLPSGVGADVERHLAMQANVGRNFPEVIARADQGLQWAPLDWSLYFLRALGEVGAKHPPAEALDDFRRARFLEPGSFEVPYQEGLAWITRDRLLALTAWREALRRAGAQRPELYARMLSTASTVNPAFNRALEEFGATEPDLALIYLSRATGENFNSAIIRFAQNDPSVHSLGGPQREQFFALWLARGDLEDLTNYAEAHPEYLANAWRGVAKVKAQQQDFRAAYALSERYEEKPKLPPVSGETSLEQLRNAFVSRPSDYENGVALYQRQMQAQQADDALVTARHFTTQAKAPAYFQFLEAEAWAAKENWERAWNAHENYEAAKARQP